jgi:hypothetical protein
VFGCECPADQKECLLGNWLGAWSQTGNPFKTTTTMIQQTLNETTNPRIKDHER